jgi:hypothetical protein
MEQFTTSGPRHFTAFRSVAEEAATSRAASEEWDNEGGRTSALSGYIVQTPDAEMAYKVVLDHENGPDTEQACRTIRECQAIIRRNTRNITPPDEGRFAL